MMNRGFVRVCRGRYDDARADFERAIALAPSRYNAHASLARVHRKQGRPDAAIDQLNKAIGLAPGLAALYREKALVRLETPNAPRAALEAAAADFEASASREASGSRQAADDHARRARLLLLRLGRPDDALRAADAALAGQPDFPDALEMRAKALLELRRYDALIATCEGALAAGIHTDQMHWLGGLGRFAKADFAGAVADYTRALDLHPNWAPVYRDRGWAQLFANAYQLAHDDFDAAIALAREDPDSYSGRGLAQMGLGNVETGIADADESLRHGEPSAVMLYRAARIYVEGARRLTAKLAVAGRAASPTSLSYEAKAVALLEKAIAQTPRERRQGFWNDVIRQDPMMRPILNNRRVVEHIKLSLDSNR
jgi:tetratricopeptide (TPR) repeat protein